MPNAHDGPRSPLFFPLTLKGNLSLSQLKDLGISSEMALALEHAPSGRCTGWGIPFEIGQVVAISGKAVSVELSPTKAQWFVFMHTSDLRPVNTGPGGFISPMRGEGQLGEHAADFLVLYSDGTEAQLTIRRRHQVGTFQSRWGENCLEAVPHRKPYPRRAPHEQLSSGWGWAQTRVVQPDDGLRLRWTNWLWAWENPYPGKAVIGIRFEPVSGLIVVSAISAGEASSLPLRWGTRHKACMTLPQGETFLANLDQNGLLQQIQLDMGQVISATIRPIYPTDTWGQTQVNQIPGLSQNEVLLEYTAHPDADFHLADGRVIAISQVETGLAASSLRLVPPATQRVSLEVVVRGSAKRVPVKLHIHGQWAEYLTPTDRHRILNPAWFEDFGTDFLNLERPAADIQPFAQPMRGHPSTYIPGKTIVDLPLGNVYIEISKGFEIRPVHKIIEVTRATQEIVIELEKVLPWRDRGWVSADTHVHFLSPMTALLEGSAEGVNVINLLASQWGELITNVGDFDGQTTWGSRQAGGDGEYLVRVGSEHRQHVLGHISLLGYRGDLIVPLTTGGPDESALGDPVEILLTEWARQCRKQGGLVVLPHFPDPRAEHAASIVSGDVDALEMTSWGNLYGGIDPYSLSDWYRYLNSGYLVPAVGGTDKMSASTAVGTVRTYAHLGRDEAFAYENWMEAIKRGETFVTYGPLVEFAVDGQPMGSEIQMSSNGGTVDVMWQVASVTIPISRVELIVNGEVRESVAVPAWGMSGNWSFKVEKGSWLALLVRGHYPDRPEIITAHTSPIKVNMQGSPILAAADAVTILGQIEGALAYIDTVGTRADDTAYKRMRLVLTSAHRRLHNRMHLTGYDHTYSPTTNHSDHA